MPPHPTPPTTHRASSRLLARVAVILAVALVAIAAKPAAKPSAALTRERYLSPLEMAFSPDGRLLYVVCQDSDEVRVVDTQSSKVRSEEHTSELQSLRH